MTQVMKPYGDTMNDGKVQLSFTLPVEWSEAADEAARQLATKMGLTDVQVVEGRKIATGFSFFVLYGSTVLLPLLMQVILGYTATQAGITNLPRGLASFLIMPIVGRLIGKFDQRKLLGIGLVASAYAMWELSKLSLYVSNRNFWLPLAIQGAALGFVGASAHLCQFRGGDRRAELFASRAGGRGAQL